MERERKSSSLWRVELVQCATEQEVPLSIAQAAVRSERVAGAVFGTRCALCIRRDVLLVCPSTTATEVMEAGSAVEPEQQHAPLAALEPGRLVVLRETGALGLDGADATITAYDPATMQVRGWVR